MSNNTLLWNLHVQNNFMASLDDVNITVDIRAMDLNLDGEVNGVDLVWLVGWLMGHGIPPAAGQ